MRQAGPLVSVVTATYNRSNVLRWTIKSVLGQRLSDWELIVVGDACTDDTASVVGAFGDPRVQFVNLPVNAGDQSGPNNAGMARARGRYVALLNHDDLWFPDHLELCVSELEASRADLVFSLAARIYADGRRATSGLFVGGRYAPGAPVLASSLVFRTELARRVGPWRHHLDLRTLPSQDWLVRVWRGGATLQQVPHLTVLAFDSDSRPGCYRDRHEDEQRAYWEAIERGDSVRETELRQLLLQAPAQMSDSVPPARSWFRRRLRLLLEPLLLRFRRDPAVVWRTLRRHPKGAAVTRLREIRGLDRWSPRPKPPMRNN